MKKIFLSRIFIGSSSAAFVLALLVAVGMSLRDQADAAPAVHKEVRSATSYSTSTTTTSLPPKPTQPEPVNLPLLGEGETLGSGSNNANVALYEQRLADLKFDPGTVDNAFDGKTSFAVQGLQKLKGLTPVDGRIGNDEITALNSFQYDDPLFYPAEPKRVEVNLDKQVLVLYEDHQVRLITPVSSGSQKSYTYVSKKTGRRGSAIANTPTGRFEFYRRYKGWEKGDLGELYNPVYFKGGVAVHGYNSVPNYPASHGCVRIPMYISEYFPSLVENGEPIYVYAAVPVPYVADTIGPVVTTAPTTTTTTTAPVTTVTSTPPEDTPPPDPPTS